MYEAPKMKTFKQYFLENVNNKSQFFQTHEEIEQWLKYMYIRNYKINDDLSVDVKSSVDISGRNIKFFHMFRICFILNALNKF